MTQLVVSAIVCTYNRVSLLSRTLQHLLDQDFSWGEYEIVVVDNASTDETRAMVDEFCTRSKLVRYIYEPQLGVAIARNTGVEHSRGRYIAFIDDDTFTERCCLQELIRPFKEVVPKPSIVSGKIGLEWEGGKRPAWFHERFDRWVSRYDMGDDPKYLTLDDYVITMNVAFKRTAYLNSGGVRENLSRKGRMFITSGDVELFKRMLTAGHRAYYQPSALAYHYVPQSRQQRSWLLKRVFGEGSTQIVLDLDMNNRGWMALFRRCYYELRGSIGNALRMVLARIQRSPSWWDSLLMLSMRLGRLSALSQIALGRSNIRTTSE